MEPTLFASVRVVPYTYFKSTGGTIYVLQIHRWYHIRTLNPQGLAKFLHFLNYLCHQLCGLPCLSVVLLLLISRRSWGKHLGIVSYVTFRALASKKVLLEIESNRHSYGELRGF